MIPAEIQQFLVQRHGVRSIVPMSPGMSGARLYRCDGDHAFVLRCWPEGTRAHRINEIQSIVSSVASEFDLLPKYEPITPDGETVRTDVSGLIWELTTWVPGQPLAFDATLQSIEIGAAAIGRTHQAFRRLGRWEESAPAIVERLRRIESLNEQLSPCLGVVLEGRIDPRVVGPLDIARGLLRQMWPTKSVRISAALSPLARREFPLQYVLRDIHREHMLFTDGNVSGIIDFDALRVDTVAVDLARWAVSFSQYRDTPEKTIDHVLAGYLGQPPFQGDATSNPRAERFCQDSGFGRPDSSAQPPEFRTLILTIAESSVWISLANWVVWLVGESRQFPDFQRVAERLSRLIESVNPRMKR